tara:strand:+ start:650 stop:1696 length:1047 start_codon:yes stop_codon:yes gene_type:complete
MKNRNLQSKFRKTRFPYNQHWKLQFTEKYNDGSEKDFMAFIKAKSYNIAKDILINKSLEINPSVKIKAIQGFMFHKKFKFKSGHRLSLNMWSDIKDASFPNMSDTLFKKEIPRDPSKSNRFNSTDLNHIRKIGFKKGKENWSYKNRKGLVLPLENRKGMVYRGKWVKWDKDEMKRTKQSIISALISNDNNRTKTADSLGIHRNALYKIMSRIPDVDWSEEFPTCKPFSNRKPLTEDQKLARSITQKRVMREKAERGIKPFSHLTESDKIKRFNNLKKALKNRTESRIKDVLPKIKLALELNSNIRARAAKSLGMCTSSLNKWMRKTSHLVDWPNEYPSPYYKNERKKA